MLRRSGGFTFQYVCACVCVLHVAGEHCVTAIKTYCKHVLDSHDWIIT